MFDPLITQEEVDKFLDEIIETKLARAIFQQLVEDGGNTAFGLSDALKAKGVRASKTRVYEEINELVKLGLIKRVSKRPPIYTTIQSHDNYQQIALKFIMNSREDLLRRWAAIYPFLPDHMKTTDFFAKGLSSGPLLNFNPYPIIDTFNPRREGLRRFLLRVFENNNLLISNSIVDTMLSGDYYSTAFEKDKFEPLLEVFMKNIERNGRMTMKTLSKVQSQHIPQLQSSSSLSKFYAQFFKHLDYELRTPTEVIASFVIGDDHVIFPIGVGIKNQPTLSLIEIREENIVKRARNAFKKAWANATVVLKIENGQIIRD